MKSFVLLLVIVIAFSDISLAKSVERDARRAKRSFEWIPFFGSSSTSEQNEQQIAEPQVDRLKEAETVNQIIGQGVKSGDQTIYPVWRVHRYNGIQLQPLPVAVVPGEQSQYIGLPQYYQPESIDQNNIDQDQNEINNESQSPFSPAALAGLQIPPELLSLAQEFGITSISQLPLDEIANYVGTTDPQETIDIIKDFAATEDGRNQIREFLRANVQNEGRANAKSDDFAADETIPVGQLLPAPLNIDGGSSAPSSSGVFQSIASFFNPFAGRQEVEMPANDDVEEDALSTVDDEQDSSISTAPLPPLPELPPLPQINGLPQEPKLPDIRIPRQGLTQLPKGYSYVRVRMPLSNFNPVPNLVNTRELNSYRNQIGQNWQQQLPQAQFRQGSNQFSLPVPINLRQNQVAASVLVQPNPQSETAFRDSSISSGPVPSIAELPLNRDNYEAFKNAPQITSSYGAPLLPIPTQQNNAENSYQPSVGSRNSYIHQEFEVRPAASEKVESRVPSDVNAEEAIATKSADVVTNVDADSIASAASEVQPIIVSPEAVVADLTSNAQTEPTQLKHPKRNSGFDAYATGKVHRANSMDLLPFTVRQTIEPQAN